MEPTTPANPILFWKEVEKRHAAASHDFPGTPPGASGSKLKIELPPPSAPSTHEDKIDSGTAVYGAFNFWKTRDVEVVQQAADRARRKPIVAPPKMPKPTDEALLQKPPIQAVRLRFLQKSKSVESIQTKPMAEMSDRRKERLNPIGEEQLVKANGVPEKDHDNKGDAESDSESDVEDIADPEAVFEVLEEVLEGVLEGDDVTSLVQKAAQKVKFRDGSELYGGIVINDDLEVEYEEGSVSGSGSGEEEGDGEAEGEEEGDEEYEREDKAPHEEEDKAPEGEIKVGQEERREEVAGTPKESQEEPKEIHEEPKESQEEPKKSPEEPKESQGEVKEGGGEGENKSDDVNEKDAEVPVAEVTPGNEVPAEQKPAPSPVVALIPQEPKAPNTPPPAEKPKESTPSAPRRVEVTSPKKTFVDFEDEIFMKYVTKAEDEPPQQEPVHVVPASAPPAAPSSAQTAPAESVPTPPTHDDDKYQHSHIHAPQHPDLVAQVAATAVNFIAMDQIDESITTLTKVEKHPPKKTGSRIIRRAGQLSKILTLRGDKDGTDKEHKGAEGVISPSKKELKEQKEKEHKEHKELKEKEHKDHKEKEHKEHKEKGEKEHKEHKEKGEKKRKGSSIFVKRDKKPHITIDTSQSGSTSAGNSPTSVPLSPRNYTEGQTFAVELDYLPFDPTTGVPKFVAAAIQILSASEFEDVDYLYFDSETNPKVAPLKAQFDTEPLDPSKPYEHVLIAGLLKLFFAELPVPLVPQRLYHNFGVDLLEVGEPQVYIGYLRTMVWALPTRHRVVLQVLVKFLGDKYLRNPANSKEYVMNKLGAAFGPILLRPDDPIKQPMEVPLSCSICRTIITNYETLFENFEGKDSVYGVRMNTLVLLQATQERIVDRLLDSNYNEPDFAPMFFTIFQIFLTQNALLDILHGLYINNAPKSKEAKVKPWKQAMANRVLDVVRMWLEFSFNDFREDKALLTRVLRDFPPIEQAYKSQQHANAKANSHMSFISHIGARARSSLSVQNVPILETSTVELAQHLTMVDFDLFCAVKPIEWLKYTEPFSSPDKKFPHLYAFQRQHSLWEYWTATEILREPHAGLRVLRVAHFIKVALICREMSNHCTSLAIVAGLMHPGIRRLDGTWQILAKDMRDIFDNLIEWHKAESEKTIEEIVTALQQTKRPFLPSPITLHRLISLLNTSHPLHPTKAPHLLDLDRLRIINAMMRAFQSILNHPYAMKAVPRLYMQLQEVSVLSGDQLMFQSMKCEPPDTPPERSAAGSNMGNPGNPNSPSAGVLMTGGREYKVPEASNNWKAEVKRIWNKPVEQLPIGIDLPRLANSIFVPSLSNEPLPPSLAVPTHPTTATTTTAPTHPITENAAPAALSAEATPHASAAESTPAPATTAPPPAEPMDATPTTVPHANGTDAAHAAAPVVPSAQDDEIDARAREIMQTLYIMSRFVEGDEYAQKIVENFGNYVVLEGAKDRDMSREIARLISEYLGKESRMVKVLKACNQAIIAPAVIELTLNVCAKVPFKDAGGWRMELSKNSEGLITVTHIKQQRQRSSNKEEEFTFEWHLEIIFDEALTSLSDVFLSIPKLNFGPAVSQSTMEGIQYTFAPYLVRR